MSVMGDKGQIPQNWQQYPMYAPNYAPFQQYPPYDGTGQFFNYFHGMYPPVNNGQHFNPMVHGPLKSFTPGGELQAFHQPKTESEEQGDDNSKEELPPLPPGPYPSNNLQQPSPPGASPMYQGNMTGPVRFNMNRPQRPQFNQPNPFNNSGSSKKKRKKKNKFNQQQQQQYHQQQHGPTFGPPIRPPQSPQISAPPLPPGPPPSSPDPPPEDVALPPEPKPKQQQLEVQQDWPPSLSNYISKCYARCQTPLDKDMITIMLKGKIMHETTVGDVWQKDWDNEPFPALESEKANMTFQPKNRTIQNPPSDLKKRLSANLNSRLGLPRFRPGAQSRGRSQSRSKTRSRSKSRSRSRSPHKGRSKSRNRRRRDRSNSSGSNNDYSPPPVTYKKAKGRNLTLNKRGGKGKKGKGRGHFYSEFGQIPGEVPVNAELLEKRAARFNALGGGRGGRQSKFTKSGATVTFSNMNAGMQQMALGGVFEDSNGDFELEDCHIVGVCQDIEKPYLRLTTAPEASAVRPPDVLKQSLGRVKERWAQNQDYHYVCEQLKSIRQDLTVQGIRDTLTVSVYETHARIALEKGDHAEFNQCQSQLKLLNDEQPTENKAEFTAYRILYYIFTKENMDLNTVMMSLTPEDRTDDRVSHALQVRSAWALSNYHKLFKLYRCAPRMSSCLMDWFLPRERKLALKTIIKAYRQTLPVSFLTEELAFPSDLSCLEFLSQFGIVYTDTTRTKIDCKTSSASVASA